MCEFLQINRRTGNVLGGELEGDMSGADLVELLGHDVAGEFGGVAFAAEMREVEMAQAVGHDLGGGLGGGDVGDVTVAAEDALLERPGTARAVLEHFDVVIGFEHEDVGQTDAFEDEFGDVAEVGDETNVAGAGVEHEADRVLGIVRDGKGLDADVADFEGGAAFEEAPVNFGFESVGGFEGEVGFLAPFVFERPDGAVLRAAIAIDGDVAFVGEAEQAGDVVGMFVGEQDGGKTLGRAADAFEALADLARGEAGVHEDAGFAGFDVGTIAGRTAAENGEFYGHKKKLVGPGRRGKFFWRGEGGKLGHIQPSTFNAQHPRRRVCHTHTFWSAAVLGRCNVQPPMALVKARLFATWDIAAPEDGRAPGETLPAFWRNLALVVWCKILNANILYAARRFLKIVCQFSGWRATYATL
jgi:hypothetical protein